MPWLSYVVLYKMPKDTFYFFLILLITTAFFSMLYVMYRVSRTQSVSDTKVDMLSSREFGIVKEIVCYNQGKIADYSFIASKRHQDLKSIVEGKNECCDQKDIEASRQMLDEYLNVEFGNACEDNFEYAIKYFENRSNFLPRVCLKVYYDNKVVPLFRDRFLIPDSEYSIDANTAFQNIHMTGKYFLCNNIPEAIHLGLYKNARIDSQKVKKYMNTFSIDRKLSKFFDHEDTSWVSCWHSQGKCQQLPPEACYKSTLVVPLTFWNNDLSSEFTNHFSIDSSLKRSVYGFLCFDHHCAGYFDLEKDINFGYIIADLLSLYLAQTLNYTNLSNSYRKATDITFH